MKTKKATPTYKGKFAKSETRVVYRDKKGRFTTVDKAVKQETITVYRQKGKFVPKKQVVYRQITTKIAAKDFFKIAIYGKTEEGENKRIHLWGHRKDLGQATALAVKHPPKKTIEKQPAYRILLFPEQYLDYESEWDYCDVES